MELRDFLRKKRIYRMFKTNWLHHHCGEKAMTRHWRNKIFAKWLYVHSSDPVAIQLGFHWRNAKHGTYSHWMKISNDWRTYLRDVQDYGYDAIDV